MIIAAICLGKFVPSGQPINAPFGKGKSKDNKLHVHHIESRKTGGDAPNNLITLCKTCHIKYHCGEIQLPKSIIRGHSYCNASYMNIMRSMLFSMLVRKIDNRITCTETYGYITKHIRFLNGLLKSHITDARCISGNPSALPSNCVLYIRKVRIHNRQLHRASIMKGGIRKNNQVSKEVNGFRLMDSVKCDAIRCYVNGRRTRGQFSLSDITGHVLNNSISYKRLSLVNHNGGYIIHERGK